MAEVAALPPVPDGAGEPRPPAAPRVAGPWSIRPSDRHARVGHHPDGMLTAIGGTTYGVLERVVVRRADRWSHALLPVLGWWGVPAVLMVVYALVIGPAVTVLSVLAVVLAVVGSVTYVRAATGPDSYLTLVAGARFAGDASGVSDEGGRVVHLYGLASVTVRPSRGRGPVLRVAEAGTRPLVLPLGALEANPQLWDLVYNGVRHSVAGGARTDRRTRELLSLPPGSP